MARIGEKSWLPKEDDTKKLVQFLRKTVHELRNCRRESYRKRQEFLEDQNAACLASATPKKIARILKSIKYAEQIRRTYLKLRRFLKPGVGAPVTQLDVEDDEGMRRLVTKEDVEEALLAYHQTYFRQAAETLFASGIIDEHLTREGDGNVGELLRNGKIPRLRQSEETSQFIQMLKTEINDPPKINVEITRKDLMKGYRVWKESTVTSPSGRNLSVYNALLQGPVEEKDN